MQNWREITTLEEWTDVLQYSNQQPVLLLKHSTTCPISAAAWQECQKFSSENPTLNVSFILVKVIESRPVSNQIAEECKIKHESPQVLFIQNQEAVWNASHWSVTNDKLKSALGSHI